MSPPTVAERFGNLAETAAKQHGVFTLSDAREASISPTTLYRNVHQGRFERVGGSTFRCKFAPQTFKSQAIGAALAAGGVVSHLSAAKLWGLSRLGDIDEMHVTIVPSRMIKAISKPARGTCVHRRALPEDEITQIDGIPVTTLARTLRDISWLVNPRSSSRKSWYWRLIDEALDSGKVALDELRKLFDATNPRCPYSKAFRIAIAVRCGTILRTESIFERRFVREAKRFDWQLETQVRFEWRRNCAQRSDVVLRSARLIIELDGRRGHSTMSDREQDRQRDLEALRHGWTTVRIGFHEFMQHKSRIMCDIDDLVRTRSRSKRE